MSSIDRSFGAPLDPFVLARTCFAEGARSTLSSTHERQFEMALGQVALTEDVELLATRLLRELDLLDPKSKNCSFVTQALGLVASRLNEDRTPEKQLLRQVIASFIQMAEELPDNDLAKGFALLTQGNLLETQPRPDTLSVIEKYEQAAEVLVSAGATGANASVLIVPYTAQVRMHLRMGMVQQAACVMSERVIPILEMVERTDPSTRICHARELSQGHAYAANVLLAELGQLQCTSAVAGGRVTAKTGDSLGGMERAELSGSGRLLTSAEAHFKSALKWAEYVGDGREKFEALFGLSRVHSEQGGKVQQALGEVEDAITTLQRAYGERKKPHCFESARKLARFLHRQRERELMK